jgi:hypothetical protein
MSDESVDVMMVAGGGRLDELCLYAAQCGPDFVVIADEHGAHEVVRVDGDGGVA